MACFSNNLIIHYIHYRWVANQRVRPTFDTQQNLANTAINIQNGRTTMSFRRALVTGDNNQDLDLNQCVHLIYAWGGSVSNYNSPAIFGIHPNRGVFSTQLCLQNCVGKCNYHFDSKIMYMDGIYDR